MKAKKLHTIITKKMDKISVILPIDIKLKILYNINCKPQYIVVCNFRLHYILCRTRYEQ